MKQHSVHATATPVQRVKLYKKSKLWVAALVAGTMLAGVTVSMNTFEQPVHAADNYVVDTAAEANVIIYFKGEQNQDVHAPLYYKVPENSASMVPTTYNTVIAELQKVGYYYGGGADYIQSDVGTTTHTYTIAMKDQKNKVTPDNPKNKGDDFGWGSTYPDDSMNYASLNSTLTQTIHYVNYKDHSISLAPDAQQTIKLTRTGTFDLAVYNQLLADPSSTTLKAATYSQWGVVAPSTVTSPTIPGYSAASSKAVTLSTWDGLTDFTVTYYPLSHTADFKFVDDDDSEKQVGDTIKITGDTDTSVAYNESIPDGYELAAGQSASGTVNFTADDPAPITVHLVHKKTTINPGGPYSNGVTSEMLNRTNTETIHYKYADGSQAAPDKVQTATATRTATYDEVTKEVTYSDWTNGSFAEVVSPAIPGYKASEGSIAAVEDVTSDVEATVLYTKNALPNTGDNGSTGSKTNNGSQSHNGSGNYGGSTTSTNETGTTGSATNSGNNSGTTTGTSTTAGNVGGTNSAATQTGNTAASSHQLPSTGDDNSAALVAVGVAAMLGTLGLASTKRRRA